MNIYLFVHLFISFRGKWPECFDVIRTIDDQAGCGSCWAVGFLYSKFDLNKRFSLIDLLSIHIPIYQVTAAQVLTDRFCIAMAKRGGISRSGDMQQFSSADLLFCSKGSKGFVWLKQI